MIRERARKPTSSDGRTCRISVRSHFNEYFIIHVSYVHERGSLLSRVIEKEPTDLLLFLLLLLSPIARNAIYLPAGLLTLGVSNYIAAVARRLVNTRHMPPKIAAPPALLSSRKSTLIIGRLRAAIPRYRFDIRYIRVKLI